MGPIYWTEFDWPSFATIAAGLSAVAGATVIGFKQSAITRRQANIAERQNEILASQADLARQTLRHELFERRMQIFTDVTDSVSALGLKDFSVDNQLLMTMAVLRANFVFGETVSEELKRGLMIAIELINLSKMRDAEGAYADAKDSDRAFELQSQLFSFATGLIRIMKPEMAVRV